jgi:hypothetical protein
MKFVITWTGGPGGSAAEDEASAARIMEVYSRWTPPADVTFHQFVIRSDGMGGFAVVESDNPSSLALDIFKFAPYFEYAVYPVLDIDEAVGLLNEAVEFRKSVKLGRPPRPPAVLG